LKAHIKEALCTRRTHKQRWICSLLCIGLQPQIEVIEASTGDGWGDAERRWIAFYRAKGISLVNGTDGGDGTRGRGTSEKQRAAIKLASSRLTSEMRSANMKEAHARRTPAERIENAQRAKAHLQKANAALTPEQRRAYARDSTKARWANKPIEERSAPAQRSWETRRASGSKLSLTREQYSAMAKKVNAARTPEQRRESAQRAANARWASR
jgi:hypothetical protein